jgi:hypothetical protein
LHFASYKGGDIDGRDNHGRYFNFLSREELIEIYNRSAPWEIESIIEYIGGGYEGTQGPWVAITVRKPAEYLPRALNVAKSGICSKSTPIEKRSFENADNSGFSTESDWFLEFYNHSLKHIRISDIRSVPALGCLRPDARRSKDEWTSRATQDSRRSGLERWGEPFEASVPNQFRVRAFDAMRITPQRSCFHQPPRRTMLDASIASYRVG